MPYPIPPERWPDTPIVREINPLTGLIEGDDAGYRKVATLRINDAPLVKPSVLCRPSYDGIDEYGFSRPEIALPGGLQDGVLVVRETFARDLDDADAILQRVFRGEYTLCALDGFRSRDRQAAGFTRLLRGHMQNLGVTAENADRRIPEFLKAGNLADGTFSWVNANVSSAEYNAVSAELSTDVGFMQQLQEYSEESGDGDAMYTYITVSANSGIGRAANRGIPLVFENNAHSGGGACDVFLLSGNGKPLNHVPFDYSGPEAGMDYLEDDSHFEQFRAKAMTDELIRAHLSVLGVPPESFEWQHWVRLRSAIRVLYHLTKAKGWTYYSSDHGGENWHLEGGNIAYDLRGRVIGSERTSETHPDSGNPGHALQKHGRDAVGVWGGHSGHQVAAKYGLEF
jgi:hypothetical protein